MGVNEKEAGEKGGRREGEEWKNSKDPTYSLCSHVTLALGQGDLSLQLHLSVRHYRHQVEVYLTCCIAVVTERGERREREREIEREREQEVWILSYREGQTRSIFANVAVHLAE